MIVKMIFVLCAAVLYSLATAAIAAEAGKGTGKLRHVVAFKFKDSASEADIKKVVEAFKALKESIPQIKAFEWGTNNSPEKHNKGTTHAFVLTFDSEKGRDEYLVHPEHKKFGQSLGPVLADVFVIDYWARE